MAFLNSFRCVNLVSILWSRSFDESFCMMIVLYYRYLRRSEDVSKYDFKGEIYLANPLPAHSLQPVLSCFADGGFRTVCNSRTTCRNESTISHASKSAL